MAVLDREPAHEALPIVPDLHAPPTRPEAAFHLFGSEKGQASVRLVHASLPSATPTRSRWVPWSG